MRPPRDPRRLGLTGAQPAAVCTKTPECDSPARASGTKSLEGRGTYLRVEVADQQDRISCPCQAWDGNPACRRRRRRRRRDGQRCQGPVHVRNRQAWGGKGGQEGSSSAQRSLPRGEHRPCLFSCNSGSTQEVPAATRPAQPGRLLLPVLGAQVVLGLDPSTCAKQYRSSAQWMQNRAPGGPRLCVHAGTPHHADDNRAGHSRPVPVTRAGWPPGGGGRSGVPTRLMPLCLPGHLNSSTKDTSLQPPCALVLAREVL